MPPKQLRSFVFTLNNYTEADVDFLRNYASQCRYLVFGYEVGESGTPHLQGYAQLINKVAFGKLHKLFPRAHVEQTKGTPTEAAVYCKKDGKIEEFGTLMTVESGGGAGHLGGKVGGEAEQARWRNVIKLAKEGNLDEIAEQDPKAYLRMYSTLRLIAKDHLPKVDDLPNTTGFWIYGPSGVGKSRGVRTVFASKGLAIYDKPLNKWWDGYQGEPVVLLDDFDPDHKVLKHYLKRWGDHYSFPAEIKGGSLRIRPSIVVVTSQYSIEQTWEDEQTREALKRRYSVLYLDSVATALAWTDKEVSIPVVFHNEHNLES